MAIIRFLAPCVLAALPIVTVAAPADADRHFSDEVFFDTSLAPASYPIAADRRPAAARWHSSIDDCR